MATTRLIPMRQNQGRSISSCIKRRTDYAKNPDKTNEGRYVTAYQCSAETVQGEFMLSKREYEVLSGRKQASNVIAYQIRQSFKPDEITPKLANRIGYELGLKFTKSNHAFIVATHIDKDHIHNHIIFNSTTLDSKRKFRNFLGSAFVVRRISDYLCLENGLSIVSTKGKKQLDYGSWLGSQKELNHSDKLRITIDYVLKKQPKDLDEFLKLMYEAGYEIKRGKHLGFKSKEQRKFIRLRSLGDGYSQDEIMKIIKGDAKQKSKKFTTAYYKNSLNLIIDIQDKINQLKGDDFEYWAKIYNLKQMAQTVCFLQDNNLIEYQKLKKKATELTSNFDEYNNQIKSISNQISQLQTQRKHIINYMNTKDVYAQFKKSGYSTEFYENHKSDIILHKQTKAAFNEMGMEKLPTLKTIQAQYEELLSSKKQVYTHYRKAKVETQQILRAKKNVDLILGIDIEEKQRENIKKKTQKIR